MKEGWCELRHYYNKEGCCWLSNSSSHGLEGCPSWKSWADIAGIEGNTEAYAFNYVIYVLFAIVFTGLAALFVITLAPYASGSGIAEVGLLPVRVCVYVCLWVHSTCILYTCM